MGNFWRLVNDVIEKSDILLIVLDARHYEESRNDEIESKLRRKRKRFVYVFNKCDLLNEGQLDKIMKIDAGLSIIMSAKLHKGNMRLLRLLSRISEGKRMTVGVLGYPNTGKSSVINALKGSKSAPVSSIPGFTKSIQRIRVTKNIYLIDTPGVFPYEEHDEVRHALIGAKDPNKLKDPELVVMEIIKNLNGKIESHYGVEKTQDENYDETLEKIALKQNILKKRSLPDTIAMAKRIIYRWQKGDIK